MISLTALMTVSMSALSKFSTICRPRSDGATTGTVGGGGGCSSGAAAGFRSSRISGRGPTEMGGDGGGPAGATGCVTVTVGCGGSAVGGVRRDEAHPAATVSARRDAISRRTLLLLALRWRARRGCRLGGPWGLARGRRRQAA